MKLLEYVKTDALQEVGERAVTQRGEHRVVSTSSGHVCVECGAHFEDEVDTCQQHPR